MVELLRGNLLSMTFKIYNVKCNGCSDTEILEFGNAFHIEMIKKSIRELERECEKIVMRNQQQFGDEWESIDKARNLLQQLLNEIKLEDV